MNKKKLFGTIALGGLVISAPVAAFAYAGFGNDGSGFKNKDNNMQDQSNFDLTDEEHLEFMKENIQLKIEHANTLIDMLDEKGVNSEILKEEVLDYAELSMFLESVDVNEVTKEELREAFFDMRYDRENRDEMRTILHETFDEEELKEIRDEFKSEKDELREKYGLPEKKSHGRGNKFHGEGNGRGKGNGSGNGNKFNLEKNNFNQNVE